MAGDKKGNFTDINSSLDNDILEVFKINLKHALTIIKNNN